MLHSSLVTSTWRLLAFRYLLLVHSPTTKSFCSSNRKLIDMAQGNDNITPPSVFLSWKMSLTDDTMVNVSLRPITETDSSLQHQQSRGSIIVDNSVDTANNDPDDGSSEHNTPDSVLQFERQMRKAQHSKKVSQPVDPEKLQVVYSDDAIVVVNKPSGVLTVPGTNSHDSILKLVYEKFKCTSTTISMEHMIVHRLDMDTSGLVVFGRTLDVTKKLHEQFRDHQVEKEYECLVQGNFPRLKTNVTYLIDLPLQRDHAHPPFMRVSTPQSEMEAAKVLEGLHRRGWTKLSRKRPKPSQTLLRVVGSHPDDSLPSTRLRLVPLTGRTHQLRVHCAALGFPIVGDPTYSLYGEASPCGGIAGLASLSENTHTINPCPMSVQQAWTKAHPPNHAPMCLHAAMLQLNHPVTGESMRWEVPPEF